MVDPSLIEDAIPAQRVVVSGREISTDNLPAPLRLSAKLGLLHDDRVSGQVIHQTASRRMHRSDIDFRMMTDSLGRMLT